MYKILHQSKQGIRVRTEEIESGISTEDEAQTLLAEYVFAYGADWRPNIKLWIEEDDG